MLNAQDLKGISAMDLLRKIGSNSNAVRRMKRKVMQKMTGRLDHEPLAGLILAGEFSSGGVRECKLNRGAESKTTFVPELETAENWLPHNINPLTAVVFLRNVVPESRVCSASHR